MKAKRARAGRHHAPGSSKFHAREEGTLQSPIGIEPKDLLFFQQILTSIDIPVYDLPEKYGISHKLDMGSRREHEAFAYSLGSGVSCQVLQHETRRDTNDILPEGSLVALKIYRHHNIAEDRQGRPSTIKLARTVWQDLRVLCHPILRKHENFCKLLYIAWEARALIPAFVLELAAYGTLQDVLQSGSKFSWLQRCHISLDIATAVHVLHGCGFVHGDLKPSNIMLQSHPHRGIVGQLTDFSGTTDTDNYGTGNHAVYMSSLWLAPEVIFGATSLEWRKVDIYTMGLILAQLWHANDIDLLESFLEVNMPKCFDSVAKKDFITYCKSCDEHEPLNVLNQALASLIVDDVYGAGNLPPCVPVETVLRQSLRSIPTERKDIRSIIALFEGFARLTNRAMPDELNEENAKSMEKRYWSTVSGDRFFVFSGNFQERTDDHQKLTLDYMRKVAGPALLDRSPILEVPQESLNDPETLSMIIDESLDISNHLHTIDDYYNSRLHFQLATCYFSGFGTKINEHEGLRYLASAALGGVRRARNMYCSVEASCKEALDVPLPRQLFLVLADYDGCSEASLMLHAIYPDTFKALKAISDPKIRLLKIIYVADIETGSIDSDQNPFHGGPEATESRDENKSLYRVIMEENVDDVVALCGTDRMLDLLNSSENRALHALTLVNDHDAAHMANHLLAAGATPLMETREIYASSKNRVALGRMTPIVWAVLKNCPHYFAILLAKSADANFKPYSFTIAAFLLTVQLCRPTMLEAFQPYSLMLVNALNSYGPFQLLNSTLLLAVEDYGSESMGRRWSSGRDYGEKRGYIIGLLLKMGADPTGNGPWQDSSILRAVETGDAVSLAVFVEWLRSKGENVAYLLSSAGFNDRRGYSALLVSLDAKSADAFFYLLEDFPDLINDVSNLGTTPLHSAARNGDLCAIKALLRKGANPYQCGDDGYSALTNALCRGDLDIAKTLVEAGEPELFVGPQEPHGLTAFYCVLTTYLNSHKCSLSAFELLNEMGGLRDHANCKNTDTALRVILRRGRPVRQDHLEADLQLLNYLLQHQHFLDKINQYDWTGRTPLHYAACYGYVEAAELFLDKGAIINMEAQLIESTESELSNHPAEGRLGWTAFDFALSIQLEGVDERTLTGGATEIKNWQLQTSTMLDLLVARGGECGSGAGLEHSLHHLKLQKPDTGRHISVRNAARNTPGDQTWQGKWPEPIPRDDGSEVVERSGQDVTDKPGVGRDNWRPVVFRTRKGKKKVLPEILLDLVGPFMDDSDSEEEGDEQVRRSREFLQEVRKHNATKLAEVKMSNLRLDTG